MLFHARILAGCKRLRRTLDILLDDAHPYFGALGVWYGRAETVALKPIQEIEGYSKAPSPAWGWAGKLGAALEMKYAAARNIILLLWILVGVGAAIYVFLSVYLTHRRQWNEALQVECVRQGQWVEEAVYHNLQQLEALRGFVETTYTETSVPVLTQTLFQQTMQRTAATR